MKNYTTYIFDLDGTITDTTSVWLNIYRDVLRACGVTPPSDKVLALHTHNWRQMLELGLPEEKLDEFIAQAHKLAKERLPKSPLHPRAYEALEALKEHGKRIAIFSTMDRPLFEPTMEYRNLHAVAEVAVAGTDVEHRKPHPAGILKALQDLGIAPEDYTAAIYIGDKATDVQATQHAGIDSMLYFPPAHQKLYVAAELQTHAPTHTIADWQELIDAVTATAAPSA